jgi:hypothetical protein
LLLAELPVRRFGTTSSKKGREGAAKSKKKTPRVPPRKLGAVLTATI